MDGNGFGCRLSRAKIRISPALHRPSTRKISGREPPAGITMPANEQGDKLKTRKIPLQMPRYRVRTFVRRTRAAARTPASRQAAVGGIEVHSCINIYNLWQQFRDKFAPWKSHLRTTIRRVEETAGFVVFPKCFVVFSKCCLRGPSGACRATIHYEKTPEQARVNRRSAPMLCKDNTFFAEIQIARFRVNISRSACAPEGIARAKNAPRHRENRLSAAMFKQKSLPLCRTSRLAAILGAGVWTAAGPWGTPPPDGFTII